MLNKTYLHQIKLMQKLQKLDCIKQMFQTRVTYLTKR